MSYKHVYSRQHIDQGDIDAVVATLRSDYLTQGPETELFENDIATYTGARHAIAVNSATSALHLTMLGIGIEKNDSVWTTPNTFVATANTALMCGASVRFIDIDPQTLNLSPEALKLALETSALQNSLPKAIIFVHFGGNPTGFTEVARIANSFGVQVIEDGSHALGSYISGKPIGCCEFSTATVFSLHAVKPITAGEGGIITTNDDRFAEKVRLLRSHGVTRNPAQLLQTTAQNAQQQWYYEQIELGFNYRMSDIHAALGRSQTQKIDAFANYRRTLSSIYEEWFEETGIETQYHSREVESARHLFVIKCPSTKIRQQIVKRFIEAKIGFNFHYIPVYKHPYYASGNHQQCVHMETYYDRGLTLPMHTFLEESDVQDISRIVKTAANQKTLIAQR